MRANGPLHEGHLAEAVRRGVLTHDQMEAVLALARSGANPGDVNVPDLRWTAVVQGIAAAVAVLVPGFMLLAQMSALSEPLLLALSALAALSFGGLGWLARDRGWGRVPASILTAGVVPYVGAITMFAVDFAWRGVLGVAGRDRDLAGAYTLAQANRTSATLFLAASLTVAVFTALLTRARRNGPAWSAPGACVSVAVLSALVFAMPEDAAPRGITLVAQTVAIAVITATGARWRPWLQRGGVDGAAWFELGVFAPLLLVAHVSLHNDSQQLLPWLVASIAVGVAGVLLRRWTYQLAGALGALAATAVGLRHDPVATRGASLVALSVVIALVAQWQRHREASAALHEPPREALSYWE
jgi:hypothetical protein